MRSLALLAALTFVATLAAQAQWQIQHSPTNADLRGIDNVGNGVAWASGSDGTILRTTDSGLHWQRCTTPPNAEHLDFRGIQAFDANTAIAMSSGPGDLSRLYKTIDACQSWALLFTNPDKTGFWDALQFQTYTHFDEAMGVPRAYVSRVGFLFGDPVNGNFDIHLTQNGGDTWTRWNARDPKHLPKEPAGNLLFAASNEAAIAPGNNGPFAFVTGGKEARIYVAEPHDPFDAGGWEALSSKALNFKSSESAGAFALAARRDPRSPFADFMVVGGDYKQPNSPGSAAFVPAPRTPFSKRVITATTQPHGYRSAVAYDPPTRTWITVGPNGTDISTDNGRNWHALKPNPNDPAQPPDADQHWNALSLPYVVGPHGRIGILSPAALNPVPAK